MAPHAWHVGYCDRNYRQLILEVRIENSKCIIRPHTKWPNKVPVPKILQMTLGSILDAIWNDYADCLVQMLKALKIAVQKQVRKWQTTSKPNIRSTIGSDTNHGDKKHCPVWRQWRIGSRLVNEFRMMADFRIVILLAGQIILCLRMMTRENENKNCCNFG